MIVESSGSQRWLYSPYRFPHTRVSPTASCIGQQLSVLGPAYGAELGAAVSFEARNPEVLGVQQLGGWTSQTAQADRAACPVEA